MSLDILKGGKAHFVILDGKYKDSDGDIPLQFNPSSYSVEQSNEFSQKKLMGLKGVINQFINTKKSDLSLELMFDSTFEGRGGDVRDLIKPLYKIVDIDNTLHSPPPCSFVWGDFSFHGIVSSFKKEFVFFFADGTPARAKVSIVLKPYTKVEETARRQNQQSSDISKKRVLVEGDTIFDMAYREYRNVAMWREIAKKNGIDDPFSIPYGTELILPSKVDYE